MHYSESPRDARRANERRRSLAGGVGITFGVLHRTGRAPRLYGACRGRSLRADVHYGLVFTAFPRRGEVM